MMQPSVTVKALIRNGFIHGSSSDLSQPDMTAEVWGEFLILRGLVFVMSDVNCGTFQITSCQFHWEQVDSGHVIETSQDN